MIICSASGCTRLLDADTPTLIERRHLILDCRLYTRACFQVHSCSIIALFFGSRLSKPGWCPAFEKHQPSFTLLVGLRIFPVPFHTTVLPLRNAPDSGSFKILKCKKRQEFRAVIRDWNLPYGKWWIWWFTFVNRILFPHALPDFTLRLYTNICNGKERIQQQAFSNQDNPKLTVAAISKYSTSVVREGNKILF